MAVRPSRPAQAAARSTDPSDYQALPRKVAAMAKRFASGHQIPPHEHTRDQLLFAVSGVMSVRTAREAWIVPPPLTRSMKVAWNGAASRTLWLR